MCAAGKADINGNEWADIFAKSIDADQLAKHYGLANVIKDGFAWSAKSLKSLTPHSCKSVRVISDRNSLRYSYETINPHDNLQETGDKILGIWNERRRIVLRQYDDLRVMVLIRFVIKRPPVFDFEKTMKTIKFDESRVTIRDNGQI